jgi:hypothetical protein
MIVGIRCADHVAPLYPLKLALTSQTSDTITVYIALLLFQLVYSPSLVLGYLIPMEDVPLLVSAATLDSLEHSTAALTATQLKLMCGALSDERTGL